MWLELRDTLGLTTYLLRMVCEPAARVTCDTNPWLFRASLESSPPGQHGAVGIVVTWSLPELLKDHPLLEFASEGGGLSSTGTSSHHMLNESSPLARCRNIFVVKTQDEDLVLCGL